VFLILPPPTRLQNVVTHISNMLMTWNQHTVTNITIARQRFGKHIPEVTQSTVEGPPSLGSKSLGTFHSNGKKHR
jgi:hypothetical protein